jgi:hypothetical protein
MPRWLQALILLPVALLTMGFASGERLFAPSAKLWEQWQVFDPASTVTVDYQVWDNLLARYVKAGADGVHRVNYASLKKRDMPALNSYLTALQAVPVGRLNRDDQLAYWINLYNAMTVKVVADHYPVKSIQDIDISPGLLSSGPWGKKLARVEGEELSLNDIEHRILRPIWRDPRIHYAVNCASIGCPNLALTAYRGSTVDRALTDAARLYVNDTRGVSVKGDGVTVSRIYDWFIEDFGRTEQNVIEHLHQYAMPELSARLKAIGELQDTQYDWTLNDAR